MEDLKQILVSKPAILIFEIILLAALILCIVLVSAKRKQKKRMAKTVSEQQKAKSLDQSLANQRRR